MNSLCTPLKQTEMRRLCYISRNYRGTASSGNKARTDNEDIISRMGGINLSLPRSFSRNKIVTFLYNLIGILIYTLRVRSGDIVFLQYPIKKYFAFICNVARLRGAKTVTLIHDLGVFRRKKLTKKKEFGRLMHSDYIIASNETMEQCLKAHGLTKSTGALGVFDYQSEVRCRETSSYTPGQARVVYAGALAMRKNAFITLLPDIIKGYRLHIYGNRDGLPSLRECDDIIFHDFTPADVFISDVEGDFGLVWDGDSLDGCTGNFGEYLTFNTPHKVSFYIRAGLPIIIWSGAALASFVRKEQIGICIDSIADLTKALDGITSDDYAAMRKNIMRVSNSFIEGHYLKRAIKEACETLDK